MTETFEVKNTHRNLIMYKGPDGEYYSTIEGLEHAQDEWQRQNIRYIVHEYDAKGVARRREIPVPRV